MNRPRNPSERIAQQVKATLIRGRRTSHRQVTGAAVRSAALLAVRGTRSVSRGASSLAREAVEGTVQAVGEIGGEAGAFVRDAVIGVVEGTASVVTVTTPAVREVVVGAIRGSSKISANVGEVGRDAVEGAIVGAASVGVDSVEAASAAVEGAVEAVVAAGGNLEDAAKATVGGVVSGVAAAGGDVAAASRDTAHILITHAAAGQGAAEVAVVAGSVVEAVLHEAEGTSVETAEKVVSATAIGVVEAAYQVGQAHGDRARQSVMGRILEPRVGIAPDLERQLAAIAERSSKELPRGRAAWRRTAIIRAGRLLLRAGGIDLSASLTFFMILSIFPLVALVIMAMAVFGNPEETGEKLTEALIYYFPTSDDLIHETVENLLSSSLAIGLIALASMVLGASGLFMAANRAVNRIFGVESRRVLQTTVTQIAIITLTATLFLLSLGLTALFQVAVSFSEGIVEATGGFSTAAVVVLGVVSTALPAVLTAGVFVIVYYRLPNVHVEWKDATFGAVVVIVLFEVGKHLFFMFTNLASHRIAVYGPVAAIAVLMMWGYVASLIFLYGAALTKAAGDHRPTTFPEKHR